MDDFVIRGVAFAIVIGVGSILYQIVSKRFDLTWPRLILIYGGGFLIMLLGGLADSRIIVYAGIVTIGVAGFLMFGKMWK